MSSPEESTDAARYGVTNLSEGDFNLLGKVFEAEMDGALPMAAAEGTAGDYRRLEREGLVEHAQDVITGRRGWYLTPIGHLTYCANCERFIPPPDTNAIDWEEGN